MPEEPAAPSPALRDRLGAAIRHPGNWLQLGRYGLVGSSGALLNLATFAILVEGVGVDFRIGGTLAFCVAVTNNFLWHRGWTFRARAGRVGFQAARFVTVSVTAFLVGLAVLWLLVKALDFPEVVAQATSLGIAGPVTFLVNRFWSFRM